MYFKEGRMGSIPVFLRKPIANYFDFAGVPDPLPSPSTPLDPPMVFQAILEIVILCLVYMRNSNLSNV